MLKVLVSGSLAYDIILDYPGQFADSIDPAKIHAINLSFLVDEVKQSIGGTAANIAFNLAMLDVPAAVLGNVGRDGEAIVSRLKRAGVDVSRIRQAKNRGTAAGYIMTDRADNQINAFHPGAMYETTPLPKKLGGCDWPIIAAENPDNMARLAEHYQKNKMRYIFDPGQQVFALSKRQLQTCIKGASIIIGNDYEISMLQKKTGRKNFQSVVFRTLGPKGSELILPNGKREKIGAVKAKKTIDPTGAGDTYRAGVIKGIVSGLDLKRAGQLGTTAAVFAVESRGTLEHKFDYDILVKRHNRNFSRKIPIVNR